MEQEIQVTAISHAFKILKGGISGGLWIVLFICSFAAIFLSIYLQYKANRKKGVISEIKPANFSWFYAIIDNLLRILAGLVVMFFMFRLAFALIDKSFFQNDDFFIIYALGVGFFVSMGVDRAIEYLQRKTNLFNSPDIIIAKKDSEQ